jgi:hypothetical protein
VTSAGGVTGIAYTGGTGGYKVITAAYSPTVTITSPGGNGATASASPTSFFIFGFGVPSGGAGYVNGDTCGVYDVNGNVLFTEVIAATSGAVTDWTGNGKNKATPPTIPVGPLTIGGCVSGSGAGGVVTGTLYRAGTYNFVPGSLYTAPPAVTFSTANLQGSITATGTLSNNLLLQGGDTVNISPTGISLGGLVSYSGTMPSGATGCGSGALNLDSNATNNSGTVTMTFAPTTTCTVPFASPTWTTYVHCRVSAETAQTFSYTASLTSLVITGPSALTGKFDYECDGQ